jgi:hypothetical protein
MKKVVPVLVLSVLLSGTAFTQGIKSLSFQNYSSGVSLSRLHSNYGVSGIQSYKIQPGINLSLNPDLGDYKSWESEKHFLAAAGELALLEFIPWAIARWVRDWEDPGKNWAVVGFNTWWRNINNGWEYDGDAFLTNFFAHPYHGNLFYNAGRTNGYDFWESSGWAIAGSALWEFFGETYRPAFNDWINTSVNGVNLGEITYRLSTMITDNTATGSERFWSEVFGTLLNPVRGFNRIISGEVSRSFPNPEWREPDDFLISFSSGFRRLDKNGDRIAKDGVEEGIFGMDLIYGNYFKAEDPFSYFRVSMGIASGLPHLNKLESTGYLMGKKLKNTESVKHKFEVDLEYGYYDIYKQDEADSLKFNGILFGATSVDPCLVSSFKVWENSSINTLIGVNGVLMGATPNDYYYDEEGRNYDFGPGVGTRMSVALQTGMWNYIKLSYRGLWIWTMSEPADSKHHIHNLSLDFLFPLNNYFAFGIGGSVYWRNSYYENFEDVYKEHPSVRVFFTTVLL